jgi:hypothetical protein
VTWNRRANFEIVEAETGPDVLVIRDLGPWREYVSVTNTAEYVVRRLASRNQS